MDKNLIEKLVLSFESRPDRRIYQFSLLMVLFEDFTLWVKNELSCLIIIAEKIV